MVDEVAVPYELEQSQKSQQPQQPEQAYTAHDAQHHHLGAEHQDRRQDGEQIDDGIEGEGVPPDSLGRIPAHEVLDDEDSRENHLEMPENPAQSRMLLGGIEMLETDERARGQDAEQDEQVHDEADARIGARGIIGLHDFTKNLPQRFLLPLSHRFPADAFYQRSSPQQRSLSPTSRGAQDILTPSTW